MTITRYDPMLITDNELQVGDIIVSIPDGFNIQAQSYVTAVSDTDYTFGILHMTRPAGQTICGKSGGRMLIIRPYFIIDKGLVANG